MFGGIGFVSGGVMFAMIGGGTFRLRADEHSQADFEAHEMGPFDPKKDGERNPLLGSVTISVRRPGRPAKPARSELNTWAEKAYSFGVSF
jgi:TfoX/Sxy family transcriptional regulator of competence genes